MIDKVYAFMYCGCIYESAYATISLHRTPEGAQKAMEFHKNELKKEFDEMYSEEELIEFGFKFGENEAWCVKPIEILE